MKRIAKAVFLILIFLPAIGFAEPETKEVTAQGVGASEREAVEDAFRNAIEESIGVYVSSETQMQNEKLIKDNILTSSNGYIDNYRLSSVSHENGMTKVEIIALVKTQEVKSKLVSLNVSVLPADELANIHARLSTKLKRNQDAEEIFKKELNDFFQPKSVAEMLTVKLISYKIYENDVEMDNTVPYEVDFETSINMEAYNKKMINLSENLKILGGKLNKIFKIAFSSNKKSFGEAFIKDDDFVKYNNDLGYTKKASEIKDISKMYFGLVFVNNNFELHHYAFPSEYRLIYPWINNTDLFRTGDIAWIINFIDNNENIVFQKQLSYSDIEELDGSPINILNFSWGQRGEGLFRSGWSYKEGDGGPDYYIRQGGNNIGPFIHRPLYHDPEGSSIAWKGSSMVKSIPMTYRDKINVNLLYSIKNINIKIK